MYEIKLVKAGILDGNAKRYWLYIIKKDVHADLPIIIEIANAQYVALKNELELSTDRDDPDGHPYGTFEKL